MIHVCFCLHDATGRYSKFTGTAMFSLFENTNAKVTVHLLHDNTLTPENRDKFICLAAQYDQPVKFYNVDELCADKLAEMIAVAPDIKKSVVSIGAFFKFLIPKVLAPEIEKFIYLDSNIIVNFDIAELWRVELGDKILGGVPELSNYKSVEKMNAWNPTVREGIIKAEDYFNSGVLLINVNAFRAEEKILMRGVKWRGENLQCKYFDQDILNYCFSTRTLKLPTKFNRLLYAVRNDNEVMVGKKNLSLCQQRVANEHARSVQSAVDSLLHADAVV